MGFLQSSEVHSRYHHHILNHPHPMAAKLKEPIMIERKEILMVKPSQPTPSLLLSLSTLDNIPTIELLCHTIQVYRATEDCDSGDSKQPDPASVIQEGLSKALVYYYPLAGRMKRHDDGRLRVTCTGEGAPFSSATANCTLESLDYFNGVDVDTVKLFVFHHESSSVHGVHPLMIQVTRFACGGFTVSMGLTHAICDGFGSAQFFRAVAELAGGKSEPSVKPVWERERLVGVAVDGLLPPFLEYGAMATSPYLPSTDLAHESFDVNAESIRRLKDDLLKESGCGEMKESLTTLEVLGAFVWRARFKAMDMNLDGMTQFSVTIGIRHVLDPPLSEGYYGNAFVGSNLALYGRELCEGPLSKVAWLIKESKRGAAKVEYVKSLLGILEMSREQKKLQATGATMVLTDWRNLGLMEADFGWKHSVNVLPAPWDMFGYVDLCMFLPSFRLDPSTKGGLRVLVCLPRAAMAKFKEEMASLKHEQVNGKDSFIIMASENKRAAACMFNEVLDN